MRFDIASRRGQAAALDFEADVGHLNDFHKARFQGLRDLRRVEESRVDSSSAHRGQSLRPRAGRHERHILVGLEIEFLEENQRRVVGCRSEAADAEALALELLHLRDGSRTGENTLVVRVFHRADEHDVMPLQIGNDNIADRDDGRIAAGKRLNRHLPAAQKNQLHVQPILAKNSFILRHPELPLPRADGRIADANLLERLSAGAGPDEQLEQRGNDNSDR